jgi:hypothetical protein
VTIHDDLFSGGRTLLYGIHGRAATHYLASNGGSTTTSVTVIGYEQLGATDDKEVFNATLRASEIAAPAEGDWFIFSGETARRYIANVKSQPNGDFTLRGWSRVERT